MKTKIERKLKLYTADDHREVEEIQTEPQDSFSNVASRSSRKLSHHKQSSTTSFSSQSSTAEAEKAALLGVVAALKNKHALEEQEFLFKKGNSSSWTLR